MTVTVSAQEIEAQIASDIQACQTLLTLLDKEQSALSSKDTDALAEIVEAKTHPLSHLEQSAKQRAIWANISAADQASEKWNQVLTELNRDKLKQDWATLKSLSLQCQQKNEVNGKILIRNQQVFGRLLDLLRGQTSAPGLYTAKGAATSNQRSVRVDEA